MTLIRLEAIDTPCLSVGGSNTPAVLCNEVVARAILYADDPIRELTLGGSRLGAVMIAAGALASVGAPTRQRSYGP